MTNDLAGISGTLNSFELLQYKPPLVWKDDGKIRPHGRMIMYLRKQNGYSRERLADMSGVSVKIVRNIESNENCRCTPETINALAAFFNVKTHTLIASEKTSSIRILTSSKEIIEANMHLVRASRMVLACIGSRSRDSGYLRVIEDTLQLRPELIHYRTMAHPPFKKDFQEHLLNLLKIRNPLCRTHGYKTLHIGIYDGILRQPEVSLVANETAALVILPSMFGVGEYNTGVLIEDTMIAEGYINLAKSLYQIGRPLETVKDIINLSLVENGSAYV